MPHAILLNYKKVEYSTVIELFSNVSSAIEILNHTMELFRFTL